MTLSGDIGGYTLTFADGKIMTFDGSGKLLEIEDRYGNRLLLIMLQMDM
jgi:hypothetical protein